MDDAIVVITGASDGIGAAAARRLSAMGATVVIVGRSPAKTKAVADELCATHYVADFSKLSDVRKLAEELRRDLPRIDVLANNAGGIFGKRELTVDGHEKTMQVNYLAPFLLTNLLLDVLVASRATVINTSSVAHKVYSKFDINDLEVANNYTQKIAYGNAKLENILFTKELHRRYHSDGISTAAFHPGSVASNFARGTDSYIRYAYHTPLRRLLLRSPAKGADTLIWLATTTPGTDWQSGEYYVKRKISGNVDHRVNDANLARELWEQSANFTAV
jgi:NAD(P)-dependent dehydrogenase (short-subunit alcohol dehydrogenase family)